MTDRLSPAAIWSLGVTQVIGYGTLYYAFSAMAPAIGADLGWSQEAVFGALTAALLVGGLLAPLSGHLVDRFGAIRVMTLGSILSAAMLVAAAFAPNGWFFAAALIGMEAGSTLVLYATAFAAIVQLGGRDPQRSITHLTLIAGFASTVFWPLTAWLLTWMDWRMVYLVFAGLNLFLCAPLHLLLGRLRIATPAAPAQAGTVLYPGKLTGSLRTVGFALMLGGFAIEGLVLSGILLQAIPLLTALGLGSGTLLVTTMFGPAQVLSRLVNMLFGKGLPATGLALIAATLLPVALFVLAQTAPSLAGAVAFACLFGLGSGLTSIVSGTLPLELLGREKYGARLGWLSSARQVASALAPFLMAVLMGSVGSATALWLAAGAGMAGVVLFGTLAWVATLDRQKVAAPHAA